MTTTLPEAFAEKIISEKIEEWQVKKKRVQEQKDAGAIKIYPFLTVARDIGCGEEKIIPQLESSLGWKVYGRNLLDFLANRDVLSRSFIETLDEKDQNLLDDWINYLIHSGAILQKDYVLKISRMIKVIVSQENAIFLGRGANFILLDKDEGVKIKLTAPFEQRVENIGKLRDLNPEDAEKLVLGKDKERTDFIKHYFNRDPRKSFGFDMVFNTGSVDVPLMCKMIRLLFEAKGITA